MGAVTSVTGGLARIHGIIPMESDTWIPPASLQPPIADGGHRVRVMVELAAIEQRRAQFRAADFSVEEMAGF